MLVCVSVHILQINNKQFLIQFQCGRDGQTKKKRETFQVGVIINLCATPNVFTLCE